MTVHVWVESLTARLSWDKMRDTPRIKAAFTTLVATRHEWPQPKHLLEAIPPATVRKALTSTPADQRRADAAIAEIRAMFQMPVGGSQRTGRTSKKPDASR